MPTTSSGSDGITIVFTDAAVEKLKQVIEDYPEPVAGLRLKIAGRAGDGFEHVLTMVEEGIEPPDDPVVEVSGLRIFVEAEHRDDLNGVTVHYEDKGPNVSGLEFDNPNPVWANPSALAIQRVFDEYVNPGIAAHGGSVQLLEVQGNKAYIEMGGGCQGCGMASVTLKQGIEVAIKEVAPEIEEVIDITDHASGTNPYYQPSKDGGAAPK
ncbi:MAG: NifU family protein [Dehalococcoidia bacterium]